jgi:hypothetical protein
MSWTVKSMRPVCSSRLAAAPTNVALRSSARARAGPSDRSTARRFHADPASAAVSVSVPASGGSDLSVMADGELTGGLRAGWR